MKYMDPHVITAIKCRINIVRDDQEIIIQQRIGQFQGVMPERYSFIFRGNAQTLDHALTSSGLDELIRDYGYGRGNADAAVDLINVDSTLLRSSDHDGLILFLIKDSDGDGVTDDLDMCPGTVIPESVPTKELRTNNFALVDDNRNFDTTPPEGEGPGASFDIFDTAGLFYGIVDPMYEGPLAPIL